jgi:hypothetical protein
VRRAVKAVVGWAVGVTAVLVPEVVGAEHWSTSTNPNAEAAHITTKNIKFPVVGYAIPGSANHGVDDFCYDGNTSRTYST